jgi:ATP-binding cassette, subfamily C, bacterial CydC
MSWIRFSKFIFRLFRPVIWQASLAILLGCFTILSGIGLIGTSAYLISYAALQPSIAELQVAIIGVRFFGLARSIFRYLERINSHSVNLRMVSKLRLWFYGKIEVLVPAKTSQMESGDLLARAMQDIETLDQFFVRVIAPPVIACCVIIATTLFMLTIHVLLGWITLTVLAGSGICLLLISLNIHEKQLANYFNMRGQLFSHLTNMVEGISDLSINGDQEIFNERLSTVQIKYSAIQKNSVYGNAFLSALVPVISGLGMIIILMTASGLAQNLRLDPKMVGVAALIVLSAFVAFQPFSQTGSLLAQSRQSVSRLFEIVDQLPDVVQPEKPVSMDKFQSLEVEDLNFGYPGSRRQVFHDLALKINAGDKIALVGPSGSGKTTLINLLLRFWEYSSGRISLNNIELRKFSFTDIRSLIRATSQKPYFFPVSIRENLNLVCSDIKETDILRILSQTELMDWINDLPDGLDTIMGERGMKLSEGQRKRLDLARTLLSDAPFIILDEPFTGIDQVTEKALSGSLFESTRDKTLLLITHHLTLLENFDEILYLSDGKISERGSHKQLMQIGGEYARMYGIQKNIV